MLQWIVLCFIVLHCVVFHCSSTSLSLNVEHEAIITLMGLDANCYDDNVDLVWHYARASALKQGM